MKKLLYTLLTVSIILFSCEKENNEKTPQILDTSNGNFLEYHKETVWNFDSGDTILLLDQIGFYNSNYFLIEKNSTTCNEYKFGKNYDNLGEEFYITTTQHNHAWPFTIILESNVDYFEIEFELLENGLMKISEDNLVSYYVKSLNTNLSCE